MEILDEDGVAATVIFHLEFEGKVTGYMEIMQHFKCPSSDEYNEY